jgi:hypothetical protein
MDWRAGRARLGAAMFAPLRPVLSRLPGDRWPFHDELTALASGIRTSRGHRLRFVAPREHTDRDRRYYELQVADSGEVETRSENWHDLFNALAWITYPLAKAQINARHAAILEAGGEAESRTRSPARDALTLFDEGGVVVASSDRDLLQRVADFQWKPLFWQRRDEVLANMRFLMFGHGAFEQSLAPYIGMVAKTVFIPASEAFLALPPEAQAAAADRLVADHFSDPARFPSPRAMPPMPILGVPGWHFAVQDEAFYDDASYFRSKPRGDRGRRPAL